MSKVYIILVNYKGFVDTIECLESILKLTYTNFQVILIDNSPDDVSKTNILNWMNNQYDNEIKTLYPELVYPLKTLPVDYCYYEEKDVLALTSATDNKLVFIKAENRGFAAANNIGLKYISQTTSADSCIWILNNDTVVEKDSLSQLVNFLTINGQQTIVGSKLRFYYKKEVLQAVAGRYNKWLGATYHVGENEYDNGQYDEFKFEIDNYVVGASIFMHKRFIDEAGLMNESFFLYYEELDWFLRAKKYSFNCALQPKAIVYHKEGSSIIGDSNAKKDTSIAEYYSITNRVKFTRKWYIWCLPTVLSGVVLALAKRVLRGNIKLVKKATIGVLQALFAKS